MKAGGGLILGDNISSGVELRASKRNLTLARQLPKAWWGAQVLQTVRQTVGSTFTGASSMLPPCTVLQPALLQAMSYLVGVMTPVG